MDGNAMGSGNSEMNTRTNLINRLKPSSKNRLIGKKYNLNSQVDQSDLDLRNWGIEPIPTEGNNASNTSNMSFQTKWNNMVKQRKQEALQLDLSQSGVFPNKGGFDDCSIISENMEYINNLIEENYQMVLTENIFITNPDLYHSIIPFLLISSKAIHRMCLSDYEIKLVSKSFKQKGKTHRLDGMDFYKIGLISFYKGKYLIAYSKFQKAYKMRPNEPNIIKWLAFTCLVIVFCYNNSKGAFSDSLAECVTKIDFTRVRDVTISEVKEEEEEETFLFGCCVNRKKKVNINLNMSYLNVGNKTELGNSIVYDDGEISRSSLCKKLEVLLKEAISLDKEEKHFIELNWMYMIIATYVAFKPDQNVFSTEVSDKNDNSSFKLDPKVLVKRIKDKDVYMGYIVYAEYNYILDKNFKIKTILEELVTRFPTKIEAYLRYWHLLIKGEDKDYKKAHQLSEIFWKNSSVINFDNNIYYLYITITHAKSLYYLGNNFYTITYFQKEYPANFLYPSIFYLFGKYSAKSNSKSLKVIALSTLYQAYKLVSQDLQYSALYWIGNVYFNSGSYDTCYKIWKIYFDNAHLSLDYSEKKAEKIANFRKVYEVLGNSLLEFKKNLNFVKNDNIKNYNRLGLRDFEEDPSVIEEQLKDFLSDLNAIKQLSPNIRENYTITYEYYRGLIHFYVEKNFSKAMKIFGNLINFAPDYMEAFFAMWKIIKLQNNVRILLNFSYFMIRHSHSSEVSFEDWVKAYILYAKALFLATRYDDAVELLRNMLDIFANIPLDEIKFLSEIHKANRVSTTNNYVNFDYTLTYYSKFHVYKKSEAIFHFNYKSKTGKEKFELLQNEECKKDFMKKKITKSLSNASYIFMNAGTNTTGITNQPGHKNYIINEESLFLNDSLLDNSLNINTKLGYLQSNEENVSQMNNFKKGINAKEDADFEDMNLSSLEKLEDYVEKNIENVEIAEEFTFITIISNPVILYEIGKFCAKSQLKCEMGLYCLKDYLNILKFQYNYELQDQQLVKKYKACFYMGVIHAYLKQYNLAKEYFDKIKKMSLFEEKRFKMSFIKAYYEFYKRHMNTREDFNFMLNKKYL